MISKLQQKISKANRIRKDFGTRAVLQHTMNRVCGPLIDFEAFVLLWLPVARLRMAFELPAESETRFLTASEVVAFASDPVNELTTSHVEKAHAGTDHCFAALIDSRIASYGWYTPGGNYVVGDHGLIMHSPPNVAHTHSGFTHPEFRGRRLHGMTKSRALLAMADRGIDTLLTDVNWANHASIRSCMRIGYQELGRLYAFGRGRHRFVLTPESARSLGISFKRRAMNRQAVHFATSHSIENRA